MYAVPQLSTKYHLDISEAMLQAAKLRKAFEAMQDSIENAKIAASNMRVDSGVVSPTTPQAFSQKEYTAYAKLTRNQRRKLLSRMSKIVPLQQLTYEQARLYHRLRGRM